MIQSDIPKKAYLKTARVKDRIRIAIVSQHFPPEGGASAARICFLAHSLHSANFLVKVITAMPSYPEGRTYPKYRGKLRMHEIIKGINVFRSWAYARPNRSVINRVLNYLSFMISSFIWLPEFRNVNVIIFSQGPMFAGFVGFFAAKIFSKPIIFDVRDLWPDRIWEAGVLKRGASVVTRLLKYFETIMYQKSAAVIGVTQGLCKILRKRVPTCTPVYLIRNSAQIICPAKTKTYSIEPAEPIIIVEAGTMGLFQDPVTLCSAFSVLRQNCKRKVELRFYGDGPRVPELRKAIRHMSGAFYFGHLPSEALLPSLRKADIGVVTLQPLEFNKLAISRRVFDYAAAGLAIVYCGKGEGADIMHKHKAGIVVPPGNFGELTKVLKKIINNPVMLKGLKRSGQALLHKEFSDKAISKKWVKTVRFIYSRTSHKK